ncbi:FG-GAP-like repeat-containing protein [Danxiaibacter flavus]|uniref:FG-GAP-like repeat-containing protein n=1 Tax=Danxiaibacter flavus TaxID=3049108 RepID=A0ABV3ZMS6_9BACT|nr:FG-GAP-like repeat-containing protein [Chitinophagaceae bacterium DXS]
MKNRSTSKTFNHLPATQQSRCNYQTNRHSKNFPALLLSLLLVYSVTAQPVITSFTPLSGFSGSTVTIRGNNFSSSPSGNIVHIGGVRAVVLTASSTVLTVRVPKGITYKPISINTNGKTAYSSVPFIIPFKGGGLITKGSFASDIRLPILSRHDPKENLHIEDLDGDGKIDLFVETEIPSFYPFFSAYRNTSTPGNISFEIGPSYEKPFDYGDSPGFLADIDGDGKDDYIFRNFYFYLSRNISTPGHISFDTVKVIETRDEDNGTEAFNIGDLDGDGKVDLFTITYWHAVNFMKNTSVNGNVSFAPSTQIPGDFSIFEPVDLNGDGKPEILTKYITVFTDTSSVSIFRNTSENGQFSLEPSIILPHTRAHSLALTGDLNKDGKPDLVFQNDHNDTAVIFINTSSGGNISFAPPLLVPIYLTYQNKLIDMDGDGKLDIVGSHFVSKNTTVSNKISFAEPVSFDGMAGNLLNTGDFDGDGKQDLAETVSSLRSYVSVYRSQVDTAVAAPVIQSFSPATGIVGDTIMINGYNFAGISNVALGGTPARSFSVLSDSLIMAIINNGSTGNVQATNAKGSATKAVFNYRNDTIVKILSNTDSIICATIEPLMRAYAINANAVYYDWYKNGVLSRQHFSEYGYTKIFDGDSIWCMVYLDKDPIPRKSNVLRFRVNPNITTRLYIKSDKGTSVCKGSTVTFKSIVISGNIQPVFLWKKNEIVVGNSTDTYTDSNLNNNDSITCTIVQAQPCATVNVSAGMKMNVYNNPPSTPPSIAGPAMVTASQNNIVFSVTPDTNVANYNWLLPSGTSLISGYSTNSITVNWGTATGKVSVKANNSCGSAAVVTKTVQVITNNTRIAKKADNNNNTDNTIGTFSIYPNPSTGVTSVAYFSDKQQKFTVQVKDINGKLLLSENTNALKGNNTYNVDVSPYPSGVYYVILIDSQNNTIYKRLLKDK